MLVRQWLGIGMMFLFVPINGPLWRMFFEAIGHPLPGVDWQIFIACLALFISGAVLTFTPNLRPESIEQN